MKRRLAAILAADVVGYTRLMGKDEARTIRRLTELRQEVLEPLVAAHHGRVVKLMGDGLLVEFASLVDAINCAVKWQTAVEEHEVEQPEDDRFLFRIGVNLGDVLIEGEDIHGDGVNIAARLEGLAEPGGICLSGDAYRQVRGKVEAIFEDLGEREVKNLAEPLRVYRIAIEGPSPARSSAAIRPLPLPDKPSIAVLPFKNMSDDLGQEYFSDGIAEDIITALSRFHQFFVIARNSSFSYKGRAVEVKQVTRELGVQYVIDGSVRRSGNRVRITAQLIDAASDHHIWAERYDRELDDIFAVQDDITERIAKAVAPELEAMEMVRARRKSLPELGVWELIARANWHGSKYSEKDTGEAEDLLYKALDIDPENARIHAWLSSYYMIDGLYGWRRPIAESRALSLEMGQKAVDLDKEDELAHTQLGASLFRSKRHEEATQRFKTAIRLNSNYSAALGGLGMVSVYTHEHDEALELLHKAIQLSPKDPMLTFYVIHIGMYYFIEKRYEDARIWAEKALHEQPNLPTVYRLLSSIHGMLGNLVEARASYEQFNRLAPGATIATTLEGSPLYYGDDAERYAEGLRRAGMPE